MSQKIELSENILGVVHEVLRGWVEEIDPTDLEEIDVAHLFGMLGTAGYSIVPNIDEAKLAQLNADVLNNLMNGPMYIEAGVRWVRRNQVLGVLEQLTQAGSEVLARLRASQAKVHELTEQLTPGSMTERAPTQWAYEKSCAAVEKHRKRADAAEAELARLREFYAEAEELAHTNYQKAWGTIAAGFNTSGPGEEVDFIRASGDAICEGCLQPYKKHPFDHGVLFQGSPYLTVLCDDTRVKL